MAEICVVHLVWKPLGVRPLRDFLASYERNLGGVAHRLVVAFNGFGGESELGEYREALAGVGHEWFMVRRTAQDIPVYFEAAERFGERYFCFLNSHSMLLDPEWLVKMYAHAVREGVGAVGATGSWESTYTCYLRWWRENLPRRPYRGMFGGEREKLRSLLALRKRVPPFPNPHLRTNAFLIARELFLGLKRWEMVEKDDAYMFENGREGMTRQIVAMGLRPLVVGRDGRAYEKEEWRESFTFRRDGQHNLLVSDNQTRLYAETDPATRRALAESAWGRR
jgi:hypothetical protein